MHACLHADACTCTNTKVICHMHAHGHLTSKAVSGRVHNLRTPLSSLTVAPEGEVVMGVA